MPEDGFVEVEAPEALDTGGPLFKEEAIVRCKDRHVQSPTTEVEHENLLTVDVVATCVGHRRSRRFVDQSEWWYATEACAYLGPVPASPREFAGMVITAAEGSMARPSTCWRMSAKSAAAISST